MNILQIPEEDESIALQRFLNIAWYTGRTGSHYIRIGSCEYGTYPRDGAVYFTYEDSSTGTRDVWELVVPQAWHDKSEYDEYRAVEVGEAQFISDFHEFIEDYAEGSPADYHPGWEEG